MLHGTLRLLRAQKTGVLCAVLACFLMGAGSLVMDRAPERYQGLHWDDLRFFLEPLDWIHLWFYGLAAALGLWGLSALVCTWYELRARVRARVTRPSAYGAPILHIAFVLALAAHLWGGLTAETVQHLVGDEGTEIDGAVYRALEVHEDLYPNGMPRTVHIDLERTVDGEAEQVQVGYNEPVVAHRGAVALLLGRYARVARATLRVGTETVTLTPGERRRLGSSMVVLQRVHQGANLRVPVADLVVADPAPRRVRLPLGGPGSGGAAFVALDSALMVSLSERRNPSAPLVGLVSLLALLGVVLVVAERRRRT